METQFELGFPSPAIGHHPVTASIDLFSDDGTEMDVDEITIFPTTASTELTSMSAIKALCTRTTSALSL